MNGFLIFDGETECRDEVLFHSFLIAILLLFVYIMTLNLYPRSKRMRRCNYVSIELPSAIYKGTKFIGVGSGPSGAPTLPSLFLTAAELDAFANEPVAPRRSLILAPEDKVILRAESRSGCHVRGKELTLFKWKYSDNVMALETVTRTRDSRTTDGTVGTMEMSNTAGLGSTMHTADTVDVERRYRKKGSKKAKDAEANMEYD